MGGKEADCLFVIIPELYDPDSGYELSTIWPGVKGVYSTDFRCGHDFELAVEYANELNMNKGHTPEFVTKVLEITAGLDKIHFYQT